MPLLSELKRGLASQPQAKPSGSRRAPGRLAASIMDDARGQDGSRHVRCEGAFERPSSSPTPLAAPASVELNKASVGKDALPADQFAALEDAQHEIASRQARLVEELVEAQVRQAVDRATVQLEAHIGDYLTRGMRSLQGQVEAVRKETAESCHQMSVQINLLETGFSSRIQELEQALEATAFAAHAKEAESSMQLQHARDLDELHARVRSEAVERQNLATQLQTAMEEVRFLVEKQTQEMDAADHIENALPPQEVGDASMAITMDQLQGDLEEMANNFQADREARDRAYSFLASDVAGAWRAIEIFREEISNFCKSPGGRRIGEVDFVDIDRLTKLIDAERVARIEFAKVADEERAAFFAAAQAENERHAQIAAELKTDLLALIDCERKARQEFQRSFQGSALTQGSAHSELWELRKSISELSKKHNRRLDEIRLRIEVVVASMAHSAKAKGKTAVGEALDKILDVDDDDLTEEAQPPIAWTRSMTLRQVKERQALLTELVTHAMEEGGLRYRAPQAGTAGTWDTSSSAAPPQQPNEDVHAVRVDLVLAALGGDAR